jgi:hypothetical protein
VPPPSTGFDGEVSVMPRSFWDEDPRFIENFNEFIHENVRMDIDGADFSPDAHYIRILYISQSVPRTVDVSIMAYANGIHRAVEIVDALTSAATTPDDLAAAIAWCKGLFSTNNPMVDSFEHQAAAHGSYRALHNQVAYFMVRRIMELEFRVRLVGLQGATHLNGRAGVIRAFNATDPNRFLVRLDDGKDVSVKAENVEHI